MSRFSLVIPTYNEAKNIESLCGRISQVLSESAVDFEIIVVDDDSPDGTWTVVERLSQKDNRIRLIRRMNERSLGSAVIAGWAEARGEVIGVIDGDFQHPPEILPGMIKIISEDAAVDIVVASRNIKGGGILKWSLLRRFFSLAGTYTSYFFLPRTLSQVRDPMSGYFILRKSVISGRHLTPMGYKILLEVLAKGSYRKAVEFPYFFQEREKGGSKAGMRQYLTSLIYVIKLSIETKEVYRVIARVILLALGALFLYYILRRVF